MIYFTRVSFSIVLLLACFTLAIIATAAEPESSTKPAVGDSTIRIGDTISVAMLEDTQVRYEGTVGQSGVIRVPYLGDYAIVGQTARQAEQTLSAMLEKDFYQKATLSVNLISRAPGTIYVYGAVSRPGAIELPSGSRLTVLQAVSKAGGISSWANPNACRITRMDSSTGDREEIAVDLEEAFRNIGGEMDKVLYDSDVVFVPAANPETMQVLSTEPCEVIVVGEINTPGIIEFAPGESRTIMRAIFKAGNFSKFAKKSSVRLIRYESGRRDVQLVDVGKIIDEGYMEADVDLQPGDMIIVDQKLFSFTD